MSLGPTLTTERLILRPPTAEDFAPFCTYMADDVTRFIGGPVSREVAWRHWSIIAGAWVVNGFSMFSVIEKETGRWVGRLGPWTPLGWPGNEVGWGIIPQVQGRGYATEAASACMDFAVDVLGWDDIVHTIAPENGASQGVAKKLGSANRGPGKLPPPVDHYVVDVWGQTAEEWKARR